jgi:HEAT repeat protein
MIVALIVGCSIIVVVMFGGIASGKAQSIDDLLKVLESGAGQRTGPMLLTKDKEMWQAAQELAFRLEHKESEDNSDEWSRVADRIVLILENAEGQPAGLRDETHRQFFIRRRQFLMLSLARLGDPIAVGPIADLLDADDALTRREAARSLAIMKDLPQSRAQAFRVAELMDDEDQVVRLVASVALASLADRDDAEVIAALEDHYWGDDRELRWNVTLTLAKLGTLKPLLFDLLERSYWEKADFVRYRSDDGTEVNRPLSKNEVRNYLMAAIEAAGHVSDQAVRAKIQALTEDPDVLVKDKAAKVLADRPTSSAKLARVPL